MGKMEIENGQVQFCCRICGNTDNNERFFVKEKMFGSKESFEYVKCAQCGCMQLVEEKMNMSQYYKSDYYSFNLQYSPNILRDFFGKEFFRYKIDRFSLIGYIVNKLFPSKMQNWVDGNFVKFDDSILDVGCGSGRLLQLMQYRGFKRLRGLDPFNPEIIDYGKGLVIYNHSLFDEHDKYDFIMLHYSFEHMPDPFSVLSKLGELLKEGGAILVRIPIIDSYSWRKYGTNWVQMDAPRHIYIHTVNSFIYLCKKCGFDVKEVIYDSTEYQFVYSEKYVRGLTYDSTENIFSKSDVKNFRKFAHQLNQVHDGDQATFYLKKL